MSAASNRSIRSALKAGPGKTELDIALSIAVGLGLAAACGFRVFVPMLVASMAARSEYLVLGDNFEWLASTPVLWVLGVATLVEVLAYYIPWLDNLLDIVATPAAVIAGAVLATSVVSGVEPWFKWTLAAIAGGGLAGSVQLATTGIRGASTVMTGGLGNLAVSSIELVGAFGLSVISVLAPLVALVLLAMALILVARRRRWRDEA
jgi:hypothetical protein